LASASPLVEIDIDTCLGHPSSLPSLMGSHPVFWTLAENRTTAGLTVHVIDEALDTGPVVGQVEVSVLRSDTHHTLYLRIARQGSCLLKSCLERICEEDQVASRPQMRHSNKYYGCPTPSSYARFRASGRRLV